MVIIDGVMSAYIGDMILRIATEAQWGLIGARKKPDPGGIGTGS